jgi:anti-sigma factor RsiW
MTQAIAHLNPEMLNAFIDDELTTSEQEEVQQHLAGCHQCTLRVLSATQLKAATARAGHRFAPPADALARLTAQLRREPQKTARIYSIRPIAWTALAAALVLAISLIGWRQVHQSNTLSAELLDQHLATLSSAATPQVISTDRHTVKPWFQGRLPFSFNLPDSGALPPDATLKGADLAYLSGQPAALLLFTIHKHQVSVFVVQRTGISDNPAFSLMANNRAGFSIHYAATRDLRFVAVSDVNPADLDLLVSTVVKAQSPG